MEMLFHIGSTNALAATVLAMLVFIVTRICRRPALGHALWLLVLVKLIAPPVWSVSIPWPAVHPDRESIATEDIYSSPVEIPPGAEQLAAVPVEWPDAREPVLANGSNQFNLPLEAVTSLEAESAPVISESPPPAPGWVVPSWQSAAAVVWLAGSVLWFAVVGLRILLFQRLLRFAQPASSEIQRQAERVAECLGLRRCPRVWLLPAPVSPMLWSLGGTPRLLPPETLWQRLNNDQKDCLLAHELAHWRRRDHWARLLELVATGLYWWHPVAWWARRELRAAEEECCDAWVLWALPSSARDYALAIVETLTFLSTSRRSCPVGASGMGQLQCLERRLTMIMRGTAAPSLTRRGLLTVAILALALLPWLPTWGQVAAPLEPTEAAPIELSKERDAQIAELQRQKKELRDLQVAYEIAAKNSQEHYNMLAQQLEIMSKELNRAKAGGVLPGSPQVQENRPAEGVRGLVKNVDAQSGLLTLSLGSGHGLKVGNTLTVYRVKPQPLFLGTVKIIDLSAREAVARPVDRLRRGLIEAGDTVTSNLAQNQPQFGQVAEKKDSAVAPADEEDVRRLIQARQQLQTQIGALRDELEKTENRLKGVQRDFDALRAVRAGTKPNTPPPQNLPGTVPTPSVRLPGQGAAAAREPNTEQRIAGVQQRYAAYMRALMGRPESANASAADEGVERQIIGLKNKYDLFDLNKRKYDELLAELLPTTPANDGRAKVERTEQEYRDLRKGFFVALHNIDEQLDRTRAWLIKMGAQIFEIERPQGVTPPPPISSTIYQR